MQNVETKLNLYFALLASLCGLTFTGIVDLEGRPLIAIFFAVFGFVFVDYLKWFALPPAMAYVALGAIAFYTLNRFATIGGMASEPQMIAVAELLVYVQAVLMVQRKSRRIYEQLAVFALLQLIVAAIFNNAISYGLLLIPICIVAIGALSLLHVYSTSEHAFTQRRLPDSGVRVCASESEESFMSTGSVLPRIGMLTIAPATLMVALVFFYALPRTNQEAKRGSGGMAQVGFSSQVRLDQIGKMMLNPEIAARIMIKNRRDGTRYDLVDNFYLRGAVLEQYNQDGLEGTWSMADYGMLMGPRQLPAAPSLTPSGPQHLAGDDVSMRINVSPMKSESLFSVPPYSFNSSGSDVMHLSDRWLITRRKKSASSRDSQISYRFATRGFRDGLQNRFIPRFAADELMTRSEENERDDADSEQAAPPEQAVPDDAVGEDERSWAESRLLAHRVAANNYKDICLAYDVDMVPSALRLAEAIKAGMSRSQDNPVELARAMESRLASDTNFKYTLDLTMPRTAGLDPIEQFLGVDRSGNCQHFASALVLMLRSQNIPARLVVGFNTDEFNNIGGYYVARQLHAHAWVEALVDAKWLRPDELTYLATMPKQYWLRLDPTPGGGGSDVTAGGRVADVFGLAQDIWTNYVVEADASDRRRESGIANQGMSNSYQLFYEGLKLRISRIRAGELGAGALAGREWFSWQSALVGIILALGGLALYQWQSLRGGFSRQAAADSEQLPKPSVAFFAEAVAMLGRVGILRRRGQTPREFMTRAAHDLDRQDLPSLAGPLDDLTTAFYVQRFAPQSSPRTAASAHDQSLKIQVALEHIRQRVDEQTHRG